MEENDDHELCRRGMYTMETGTQRIKKKLKQQKMEITQNKNAK